MVKVTICTDQSSQISYLFFHSDEFSALGIIASIFCSYILNITITAHHRHTNLKPKSFQRPLLCAMHRLLWLVLLASRPPIMMAASQEKLTSHI
jgi:hypothetical protein